jgi:hypothetical protein
MRHDFALSNSIDRASAVRKWASSWIGTTSAFFPSSIDSADKGRMVGARVAGGSRFKSGTVAPL